MSSRPINIKLDLDALDGIMKALGMTEAQLSRHVIISGLADDLVRRIQKIWQEKTGLSRRSWHVERRGASLYIVNDVYYAGFVYPKGRTPADNHWDRIVKPTIIPTWERLVATKVASLIADSMIRDFVLPKLPAEARFII